MSSSNVSRRYLPALALLAGLAAPVAGHATLIVSAAVGGAPTGVSYVNFDSLSLGKAGGTSGGVGVSFSHDAEAVRGSQPDVYAAPFLSNNNGALFGDAANGVDTTTYLTTGTGSVTLTFPGAEHYLGLLWGSVDDYNTLSFYNGATLVGSIDGSDVTAGADGNLGASGTFYVNINSTLAFTRVVASSSSNAFEIDNVAYSPSEVPEPASLGLIGTALGVLGLFRRQRSSTVAAS